MTPTFFRIKYMLDREYHILDRSKITHWLLYFKRGINIDDCRGGRITVGGDLEFRASVRDIFWQFIRPCLEDIIEMTLRTAEEEGRRYSPSVAHKGLDEASGLLKTFVSKVYNRMVEVDRLLRGKGYPENVDLYDASHKIEEMWILIDERANALKDSVPFPSGFSRLFHEMEKRPVLVNAICTIFGAAIGAILVSILG